MKGPSDAGADRDAATDPLRPGVIRCDEELGSLKSSRALGSFFTACGSTGALLWSDGHPGGRNVCLPRESGEGRSERESRRGASMTKRRTKSDHRAGFTL